jgi:hypothetical protein
VTSCDRRNELPDLIKTYNFFIMEAIISSKEGVCSMELVFSLITGAIRDLNSLLWCYWNL